ncbi:glutathione S-transferase family protein [uncultured Rhodoferax sp.]|uniref:glutathione S-transferase family protein n=1 Tax=uncultured Rhodoferax sp. TaxID=223188 RepID=UPI0025F30696|nr:glutathione S-transferase family protein [uncultured Rhodoferax sp.]
MLKLYIANKNYSSWSMRPWVLLKQAGIDFEEVMVRFDDETGNAKFKAALSPLTPTLKVPLLVDGALAVWDSLAIAEYVAEQFSGTPLWPQETSARARARSICAEMHSGFGALRSACSMNIEADLREAGALIWRDNAGVRADVMRLTTMWEGLIAQYGGPMLFGHFSVADAYFAPVCSRLKTYGLPMSLVAQAYVDRVWELPGVQAWVNDALAEQDFLTDHEPYRLQR